MTAQRRQRKPVDQTKIVTTGSTVRIETPSSSRQKKPNVAVVVAQEINPASGFIDWLRQNAVIGLAVGFVVGTQMQVVVKQLIESFINPVFQLLFGGQQLNQRTAYLHFNGHSQPFAWGAFVSVLINFLFILLTIYIVIKFLKLEKFDKPKPN